MNVRENTQVTMSIPTLRGDEVVYAGPLVGNYEVRTRHGFTTVVCEFVSRKEGVHTPAAAAVGAAAEPSTTIPPRHARKRNPL